MNRRGFFKVLAGCVAAPTALFVNIPTRRPDTYFIKKLDTWKLEPGGVVLTHADIERRLDERVLVQPRMTWPAQPRDHVLVFSSGP